VKKRSSRTVSEGSSLCLRETEQKLELSLTTAVRPGFSVDRIAETEYMIEKGSIPLLVYQRQTGATLEPNRGNAKFATITNG